MLKTAIITLAILCIGCSSIPKVQYTRPETSGSANNHPEENVSIDSFLSLLRKHQGYQVGDPIFKRNSVAYWITPEIDKLDLDITAREERFASQEYESRLNKIKELHDRYLIFSLELSMPFYPKWTQAELLDYLKNNLILTLENGSEQIFSSDLLTFNIIERFAMDDPSQGYEELEIDLPVRVHFTRAALTSEIKQLFLKIRLKKRAPFKIGFFDEKFYQGFKWKVVN